MSKIKILKILIANRGEIALRIQRTCRRLKIPCVITVSETDRHSYFAEVAEEPAFIGGQSAKDSYLNIGAILKAAKKHKCNAIHPGYGFLSENAEFARKVVKAGLIFIGPNPKCIEALGDKAKARKVADKTRVPVTPGTKPGLSDKEILKEAAKIKYPVLIKAVAGGGGRGMRVVTNKEELIGSLPLARSEAMKNFLDSRVYLEKYIDKPRHVEVQLVGDKHGNVASIGTRDCSTQRRHQKLIEEAPAPFLRDSLKRSIEEAAVRIARYVGYDSVGTAEFLVANNKFYFLEMNTRIQVEHPVTEEVSGLDLIELQLMAAEFKELPRSLANIELKGHSIEFRINAEDASQNFRPISGKIQKLSFPKNSNLRVESGFKSGDEISPYYDGLICKIIVNGKNRAEAIKNAKNILPKTEIKGLKTTLDFHQWALCAPQFLDSTFDIAFIDREFNPNELLLEEASKIKDRKHKGANYTEVLRYHSELSGKTYEIDVIHLSDGTFLFIPKNSKRKAKEKYCRRSNSYNAALQSLKKEVLEKENPRTIF